MTMQEKLYEKLCDEHTGFLGSLQNAPAQTIIDAAQEIVAKENIVKFFKDNNQFDNEQAKWLHDHYSLDELYTDWGEGYGRLDEVDAYAIMKYAQGSKSIDEEIDRTYKAELKLPDQKDLHFEVFTAVDDVAAVKYAYELCMDWDDVQLMEVHELNDNYDIIREIDLKNHDPSLRRFMDVDLFDFLGHISDKVLIHYRNDWNIDKEFLLKRAESSDPNDKRVAWHVCATSSHQLDERDVFIKESGAFGYWTDYHQNDPDMFGFFVEITGHENGKVYGNVFEVGEYIKHVERVRDIALPIDTVTLEYSESRGVNCGLTITVPRKEYDDDRHRLMCDSGNVISVKMNPLEKDITMADLMKTEQAHRMAMPKGNTQVYLQKLEEKLFAIRGEPLEHMIQLVPKEPKETPAPKTTKPTAPTVPAVPDKKPVPNNPQGFEAFLKEAQAKADKFNAENAQRKGQQPDNTKTNPEIGE